MNANLVRARNNVQVQGDGPRTIVLAHGLGTDQTTWAAVSKPLSRDYRVVLFDHVGSGASDRSQYTEDRYGVLEGYASDLAEIVRAFGCSPDRSEAPIFVGHSIASSIGVIAAVKEPSLFSKLVLLAPSPRYLDDPPSYKGGFKESDVEEFLGFMDQNFLGWANTFSHFVAPEEAVAARMKASFIASDPRVLRRFSQVSFMSDIRALLPRVSTETIIIQCSDDAVAPVSVGELMHRTIPRSAYRLIEVGGHCPQLSHPHLVEALVREAAA